MKKLVFLLVAVGAMFTSCDPMEDIYDDLDSVENPIVGSTEYTLTDDDYAIYAKELDSVNYFQSEDQFKELIPGFLSDTYPFWGKGSSVFVTYDLYKSNSIKSTTAYTVTEDDYATLGFTHGNFDSSGDMTTLLMYKYPDAGRGDLVELTYLYYESGSTTERTNSFVLLDSWEMILEFTYDDYIAMDQSYANFTNEDVAEYNISIYLKSLYPYAMAGDTVVTMYELYVSGADNEMNLVPYTFDGTSWNAISSVIASTLQFGHDGTTWVPDNTITYTLVATDYEYMSTQLITTPEFEDPADSMGYYKNFDRREGNSAYWSLEMIETAMAILLDNNDPTAEDGQKYLLTYDIYNGTNTTESMSMIKTDGAWELNE
ncbi:hypothetical protein FNB79_05325 [Formosa sediminum]|uniref:Uncharacterized protein n=1 Tax=Formosa sediminum TaxID=2594004 RepID=A0A516GPH1_9FLAO|nr:hypothetical protein [Formosa sediminum]QDO93421.1 hypothetical protein FNB79_05325 [Formosa sediminum]